MKNKFTLSLFDRRSNIKERKPPKMALSNKVDHSFIQVKPKKRERERKRNRLQEDEETQFCFKMYRDWKDRNIPFDIPVLILDEKQLFENKDLATIPRLNAKYQYTKRSIPFIYDIYDIYDFTKKYQTLDQYFFKYTKKYIPSFEDFKKILTKRELFELDPNFFESVNLFLYTSFLLRQFSCAMKIIPYFYTPIQDEAKYIFYICVDYLRQICMIENKAMMRSDIIHMIEKLYAMEGAILNDELFLEAFPFMSRAFIETNRDIFIQKEPFHFVMNKK